MNIFQTDNVRVNRTILGAVLACLLAGAALFGLAPKENKALKACFASRGADYSQRAVEAAKFGIWKWDGSLRQQNELLAFMCPPSENGELGFSVATDYQKTLASPMTSSQSTLTVSSLVLKDGVTLSMTALGTRVFLTVEPGATKEEIIMCTGITASSNQFTGCTRGLAFSGTATTAVAANQYTHSAGSVVVMSNVHYVYQQYFDLSVTSTQTVSGPITFSGNQISIGDDTTTTNKFIYFPVNQGTEPYFKIVGPGAGSTTSTFYFSLDGSSDLQLNASGTTFGASSTAGIFITSGLVGVNASSTAGLAFDTSGVLYVNASTTGGLNFDGAGRIKLDTTDALTWTGTWLFQGNATATGNFQVNSPTSSADATNKGFVDNAVVLGSATGTAGEAITAGRALYSSNTSTLWHTNTNGPASSTVLFVGFAKESGAIGAEIDIAVPSEKVCGLSGLLPGFNYYLNGTAGQIDVTPGVVSSTNRIGRAITASCLQIEHPKFVRRGAITIAAVGYSTTTLGFYPANVSIRAGCSQGAVAMGISVGDDANGSVFTEEAAGSASYSSSAFLVKNSSNGTEGQGGIVRVVDGFVVQTSAMNATTCEAQWTASSE